VFVSRRKEEGGRRKEEGEDRKKKQLEDENTDRLYSTLLQQAKTEDLSEIAKRGCMFQAGQDTLGRPIIVVFGARFPEKQNRLMVQKFLKFIIRTLDALSGQDFILTYFHCCITQKQEPEFAWLQMIYRIFDRKFPNLKYFYIVHPSLWVKFTLRLLMPFLNNTFTPKMVLLNSLAELFSRVEHESYGMKIPSFVYKYDRQENGSNYNAVEDNPANEGL